MPTESPNKTPAGAYSEPQWQLGSLPPSVSLYVLATLVGLITGGCAFLLKSVIKWLSILVVNHFNVAGVNWALLVVPLIGIILTVALRGMDSDATSSMDLTRSMRW